MHERSEAVIPSYAEYGEILMDPGDSKQQNY